MYVVAFNHKLKGSGRFLVTEKTLFLKLGIAVKTNLKEYDFKYRLIQYWKKGGLSDVESYNSSLGFSHYITNHIGKKR